MVRTNLLLTVFGAVFGCATHDNSGAPAETASPPTASTASGVGTLEVRVTGLKSQAGRVYVSVFRTADGFPGDARKAHRTAAVPAGQLRGGLPFEGLPFGTYAVVLFHDENGNGAMDVTLIGIPKEGTGVSNNHVRMGPPLFEHAKFELNRDRVVQSIVMRYL
jgi:uncharacterized protein (DUF2141 family)